MSNGTGNLAHDPMRRATSQTRPTSERIRLLQSMAAFGGLNDATLEYLLGLTHVVQRRKGEYFYHEGEPAQSMFVLESGKVAMYKRWEGRDYRIHSLERGESFGQVALIDLGPRNTSTLALTGSSAIELTSRHLHDLYRKFPDQYLVLYMNMARDVCRRLRIADQRAFEARMQDNDP